MFSTRNGIGLYILLFGREKEWQRGALRGKGRESERRRIGTDILNLPTRRLLLNFRESNGLEELERGGVYHVFKSLNFP